VGKFVKVAIKSEIADQSCKLIEIEGKQIALFNLGGDFYAIDDTCPHEGGPLSEGEIKGDEVACPWHSSRFDIRTGEVTQDPAVKGVSVYRVRVIGEEIEIEV